MATMNVSLPDPMRLWVDSRTRTGRYGNASDYIRDLIRRDQERQEQIAQFQSLIDEGLASGLSPRSIAEVLQEARARAGITGRDDV